MFPASADKVTFPIRFKLSVRLVISPLISARNTSGIFSVIAVIFIRFNVPSTPAFMDMEAAGQLFTTSCGKWGKAFIKSFFPILAMRRARTLAFLFIFAKFQSASACNSKSEFCVVILSNGMCTAWSSAKRCPLVETTSSPERSFRVNLLINARILSVP